MREIKLIIHPDGTTEADFSGFIGPSCLAEAERLRELLAALGVQSEVLNVVPKPELSASQTNQEQHLGRSGQEQGGRQ
jgi:hypothetical protein